MRAHPRLTAAHLAAAALPPGAPPAYRLAQDEGPLFVAVEMEVYRPGAAPAGTAGHLARAHLAPRPAPVPLESTEIVRASDLGYRTRPTDPGGVVAFPPVLESAFEIDRRVSLSPFASAAAFAYGALKLANVGRRYDAMSRSHNSDGRPVRILIGRKRRDDVRGLDLDPPRGELAELFAGVTEPWALDEAVLTVPLRDATYWLERPFQYRAFAGTGGLEGGDDLRGRSKPRTRGGTVDVPVRDVPVVWIDRVNWIGQLSDAPGIVTGLSERGDPAQILPSGPVADIEAIAPAPGRYVWSSTADGLFVRLGSAPQGTITCDVVGHFPSGARAGTAAAIARLMLIEDMALPAALLDAGSFDGLDAAYPWQAGDHWDGSEAVDGAAAVGLMLASLGARLIPARTGRLRAWALRPLPLGTRPVATYTPAEIVDLRPTNRLREAGLSPPAARWRATWGRCHGVQTDLDPDASLDPDRKSFLAAQDRTVSWSNPAINAAWRRPSDPEPVPTRLLLAVHAIALTAALGGQWSTAPMPGTYDLTLPLVLGLRHDIGDALALRYPLDNLDGGRLAQVVGEQVRSGDTTITLPVLVQ